MARPDMSIKVERKLHDMRILGRIVGARSTEQSVRHLLTLISFYCRNRHTHPAYAFISFTSRLVPRRDAPSPMNFSASSKEEIPPAALIFTFAPTCFLISATSSKVAPAAEKPVEVLINSAPALVTISHLSLIHIYGGIGRRAGFRCLWWQHRVGSSPILRIGVRYQLIPDFFYVLSKADIRNPSLQLC